MNGPLEGLPHYFCKLQDPNKYKNVQTDKTFFCGNMKNDSLVSGHISLAQKIWGLRLVLLQKLFKG